MFLQKLELPIATLLVDALNVIRLIVVVNKRLKDQPFKRHEKGAFVTRP